MQTCCLLTLRPRRSLCWELRRAHYGLTTPAEPEKLATLGAISQAYEGLLRKAINTYRGRPRVVGWLDSVFLEHILKEVLSFLSVSSCMGYDGGAGRWVQCPLCGCRVEFYLHDPHHVDCL